MGILLIFRNWGTPTRDFVQITTPWQLCINNPNSVILSFWPSYFPTHYHISQLGHFLAFIKKFINTYLLIFWQHSNFSLLLKIKAIRAYFYNRSSFHNLSLTHRNNYLSEMVQGTARNWNLPFVITAAHQATNMPIIAWATEWITCWGWIIFPISANREHGIDGTTVNKSQKSIFVCCR